MKPWKRALGAAAIAIAAVSALILPAAAKTPTQVEVQEMIVAEALQTSVPPSLALAVARVESNFRPHALSRAGARGVMQILPSTARAELGADPDDLWDPATNIRLGLQYLERLIQQYEGRWDLALSHYNAGSLRGHGATALPHPWTRKYVETVLTWQRRFADQARIWQVAEVYDEALARETRIRVRSDPQWSPIARYDEPRRRRGCPCPYEARYNERHGGYGYGRYDVIGDDDFDGTIEERRRRAARYLDDFGPSPRGWPYD